MELQRLANGVFAGTVPLICKLKVRPNCGVQDRMLVFWQTSELYCDFIVAFCCGCVPTGYILISTMADNEGGSVLCQRAMIEIRFLTRPRKRSRKRLIRVACEVSKLKF